MTGKLKVNEIFYSLQGEGANTGLPMIFIRLSGCSIKEICYNNGVLCDTEFESGKSMEVNEIIEFIKLNDFKSKWILFTGGEPLDKLKDCHISTFKENGFKIAIETSGAKKIIKNIDYITVSPKVAEHILEKNFPLRQNGTNVDELRYIRTTSHSIPMPKLLAFNYFISPMAIGANIPMNTIEHCVKLCLDNPEWKLSIQTHKVIGVQ